MIVTGLFIAGFTVLAAIVLFGLRRLGHTTDDDYLTELLWDAHHAVTDAHRTADEAEAFVRASTGWALPNYADHQERVRLEK
jgi:3-methyladenine DNA glycosylase AlkD